MHTALNLLSELCHNCIGEDLVDQRSIVWLQVAGLVA